MVSPSVVVAKSTLSHSRTRRVRLKLARSVRARSYRIHSPPWVSFAASIKSGGEPHQGLAKTSPVWGCGTPVVERSDKDSPRRLRTAR